MRMKNQSRHDLEKSGFDADPLNRFASTSGLSAAVAMVEKNKYATTQGSLAPNNDNRGPYKVSVAM